MFLLCTTLSLVLGLYFLHSNIVISILLSVAYLVFIFVRFNKKQFFIVLCVFATGAVISNLNLEYNSKNGEYAGFVVESKKNYVLVQCHTEKFYVYEPLNDFEVGDYLVIDGYPTKVSLTTYESQFNFKDYLQDKGVKRELKVNIIDRKISSLLKIKKFKSKFLSHFDENAQSLISAFLFNEKDYESDPVKLTSEMNIVHLMSLSGIYLHLIFAASVYLFSLKINEKLAEILPFFVLLPYAFFSLSKVGTLRVYSLYLLKFINKHKLKKKFSHIELVSILALIFLTIDYHLVYQEAFYIGFSLSALSPFINNSLGFLNKKKRKLIYPIVIFIYIFPNTIHNSTYKPLSFLYSIILFIPSFIFLVISMTSFLIPIYKVVNFIGNIYTWILRKMELINISIPFSSLNGMFGVLFFILFIGGIYLLESVRLKELGVLACIALSLLNVAIIPFQEPLINAVYFINVGQGDSILIKNRNHVVMIDTGGYKGCDMAKDTLIPFMTEKKINHIDALIITHDDFDHNGAKDSLISNFKVNYLIDSPSQFPYEIGDLKFENFNIFEGGEDNEKSLVIKLDFMKKKWLFMGDASTDVEEMILESNFDVDADILKVGHHGSKTSTSEKFLKAVSPETAIISVGANNFYGHPNTEVIEKLNKYNVKIRRTDEEGTISYLSLVT